ncbi:MAG: TetR/AcrR family transcriptional regulator [Bacillus sp. (in: Bacteria)]|nr:TetR/AcrR family transcriptional regulator [Bacillus sp. (in: firmicutes)]
MPPKAKISKEMVIDAAFEVARAEGAENVNARTVAQKLGCSTQPVMYHFATIEELKRAAYEKADAYHTEYLMNIREKQESVMLGIGINYIRFAVEEPNLFRFLFQSGFAAQNSLLEMVNSEELIPVLSVMQEAMKMNLEQTKEIFITLAMFVHGYASIIANNSLEYDEKLITTHLKRVYTGAVLAIQEEKSIEKN